MRGAALVLFAFSAIGAFVLFVARCGDRNSGDSRPTLDQPEPRRADTISHAGPLPRATIASARADLDGDAAVEEIEFLADVELGPDGEPIWEDGHRWMVVIRDGSEEHRVVDEFVPQGRLSGWVVEPDEGSPIIVVLEESGTAGIALRAFRHAGQRGYVAAGGYDGSGRLIARLREGEIAGE